MKKYTSVFSLFVRSTGYSVLGSIVGFAIGQAGLFAMRGLDAATMSQALSRTPIFNAIVFCISMISAQLCVPFCDRGGKMNNTLQRLRISEKKLFWMQAACNVLMFTLYFLIQGLIFLGLCFWYDPEASGLQILVTAYDHPLFHQFFPLDDGIAIVTNIIMIIGLSISCAAYPMRQRHGKYSITTFIMVLAVYCFLSFQKEGDHLHAGNSMFFILACLFCIAVALWGTMNLEVDDND